MYNEELGPDSPIIEDRDIEVLVSVTLSKTFKIKVNDYKNLGTYKDEDGNICDNIDYSECNLKKEVEEQIYLPQEAGGILKDIDIYPEALKTKIEHLSGWNVDEFIVIKD